MEAKAHGSSLMSRRWVAPVGMLVILGGYLGMSGVPYWRDLSRLRAQTAEYRLRIEENARESEELRDLTKQLQVVKREVEKYDRFVPPTQDKSAFSDALSNALQESGLKDANRAMLAPTKLGRCVALPIELHMTCSAEQFMMFLQKLEGLKRRSSVSKLNIEADARISGQIAADMTLSIYSANSTTSSSRN